MNQKTLQAARFLDLAKDLHMQSAHVDWIYIQGTAAFSAVVRLASMDLTRALEDLRRAS